MSHKIYLAGPISGRAFDEVVNRYKEKTDFLRDHGYEVLSPMTAKGAIRTEVEAEQTFRSGGYENHPVSNNHSIFARDKWMVTQADIILADLSNSGDRVSIGTMMELAWASYLNKHTVVVLPPDNVHNHAFVKEAANIVLYSLEDAYDYLKALVEGAL